VKPITGWTGSKVKGSMDKLTLILIIYFIGMVIIGITSINAYMKATNATSIVEKANIKILKEKNDVGNSSE